MGIIASAVQKKSAAYEQQDGENRLLSSRLKSITQNILSGGSEAAKTKQRQQGKLLVRERIDQLLDQGSPFLEMGMMAGYQSYEFPTPAAGLVTGIGQIHGIECMIIANDCTIKGGCYFPLTVKKHLRAQEIAQENHLPCIYLVDSGGAYLPEQARVFPDQYHFGRIFYNQARLSAMGIPQIAVVMGSCTAGGAYIPAMADQTIMVKNQATIFLAGPPLVKAAINEIVTAETLGGTEVHTQISGVADYAAENDQDALAKARELLVYSNKRKTVSLAVQDPKEPRYAKEDLYGLIPIDSRQPLPMIDIIARLVDNSEFSQFKPLYGSSLLCGFAHLYGYPIGVIANNGILFPESANKGTHFIQLCCQRKIPLLFLQDINGFMVGKKYEHSGIAKAGAKMVAAVACAEVPKITFIVGGSYGAGNYAMCGRAYQPRFLFMWPNAKISVMGGDQAALVLAEIKNQQEKKPWSQSEKDQFMSEIKKTYQANSNCYAASSQLFDDGVIDPIETRRVAGLCLLATLNAPIRATEFGIFRI